MKKRLFLAFALLSLFVGLAARAAERPPLLTNGTEAPDFTAYRPDGSPVKLSDFRGKTVLIDFWSTWCGPCKVAMPHMESLHKSFNDDGLVVLGVCTWDTKAAFDAWQKEPEVPTTYLKVFDPAGRGPKNIAKAQYNVSGIPTFYLVDKEGRIFFSGIGAGREVAARLDAALAKAGFRK